MATEGDRTDRVRLLAEPARLEMCMALLGGQALSAGELARAAGIARSTTSEHLSRMVSAGLVTAVPQGRHRYYRLANAEVAEIAEYLVSGAAPRPVRSLSEDRRRAHLRLARTCYDHLAGVVAVQLAQACVDAGALGNDEGILHATESTMSFFSERGLRLEAPPGNRRPLVRSCLDWTERQPHLAGLSGAAILNHLTDIEAVRRRNGTRAVEITKGGKAYLSDTFGFAVL